MIEALLDVMKWPSWILHLSDCETGSTIAAIIVLGPRPIFHCTSSTALLWLPRTSQWTCGFGFSLLRMWAFHSTHSNSRRVNWPPQSLGRFTASRRGRRRLPGSRGSGDISVLCDGLAGSVCPAASKCRYSSAVIISWNEGVTQMCTVSSGRGVGRWHRLGVDAGVPSGWLC